LRLAGATPEWAAFRNATAISVAVRHNVKHLNALNN